MNNLVKFYEDRLDVVRKDVFVAFNLRCQMRNERMKQFVDRRWNDFLQWEQEQEDG